MEGCPDPALRSLLSQLAIKAIFIFSSENRLDLFGNLIFAVLKNLYPADMVSRLNRKTRVRFKSVGTLINKYVS